MIARYVLFLSLMFCCAVARLAQAQDPVAAVTREADERITTLEGRQQAVKTLLAKVNELRNAGQTLEAARTLNRAGRFQIRLFQKQEALVTFQEALKLLEQTPDTETRIDSLNGLGESYRKLSQCNQARTPLDEAITLSKQSAYKAGQAQALLTLSDCQNYSDHDLALGSAKEALELWSSVGDKRGAAEAHAVIGHYEMAQNNLTESEQNFVAAQALWRELNAAHQEAEVLINLGFIEFRKGAWQDSLKFYTQAQNLIEEKAEPYVMGQIAAGLGEAFIESGLPEIGLAKFREALGHYRETKNQRAIIAMEWAIGKAQFLSGDYPGALAGLETARTEAQAIKEIMLTAMCDDFLGRTRNALNDLPLALSHFQAALDGYRRAKNPLEVSRTRVFIGGVYQRQGKSEQARAQYEKALESFRGLSDRVNESAALFALGRLELEQNSLDQAESYLRQSIDVTENMRRISTSRDLIAAFSATVHDRYELYIECLMRKHRADPSRAFDARAFETSELARARSLAELLRATQVSLIAGLDPKLAEREKVLRQSLRVKEDYRVTLLGTAYRKEELDSLESELEHLESEYKQVTETIRARYPAYGQITKPVAWTLSQIQERVLADDQTLLLEYSLGTERSYVWAVTRTQISTYELPGRAEIESEARLLYDLLTAGQPKLGVTFEQRQARLHEAEAKLPAVTSRLSKMLLAPVADKLGTKRLIIVADGALQYIPFQALSEPVRVASISNPDAKAAEERPLILDHEIINEPSASILALLSIESANRQSARGSVAVLADPVFHNDDPRVSSAESSPSAEANSRTMEIERTFRDIGQPIDGQPTPRLLASRDEAKAIMGVVPSRTGLEALDFDANRVTLSASQLDQYRVVHFATHAFVDDKNPQLSGLVLSLVDQKGRPQEGFVGMNDIYNLKIPVSLVVLSACNTGLGKDVRGEGLIGVTRGFMYAGASGVTASLWKVDDEATAELMKRFYEGMFQQNLTPAAALRQAQIAMWQQKRWRAPYYWAGFIIQGQYDQKVSFSSASLSSSDWSVITAGLLSTLFLACCVVLKWRRKSLL